MIVLWIRPHLLHFIRWRTGSVVRESDKNYDAVALEFLRSHKNSDYSGKAAALYQGYKTLNRWASKLDDTDIAKKEKPLTSKELSSSILPMVRRIYPELTPGAETFANRYKKMTQKDVTDAIINSCTNSTCSCQASDVATCSTSNSISQAAANCSGTITSNAYTKKEVDEKMSNVTKTFEKELEAATVKIQLKDIENTHSVKSSVYKVEEKVVKLSETVSWTQIQHYITWLMLAIIGLMIFFKSFDVSIDVNNPIENQEIILEKTND